MTIKHLAHDTTNTIALGLNEDVYGASGDFNEDQIKQRLIENIHRVTDYQYAASPHAASGLIPVWRVADLIRSVWEYMDRHETELMASLIRDPPPKHGRRAPPDGGRDDATAALPHTSA